VGTSKEEYVGPIVGQGTIGGAIISQVLLDYAILNEFEPWSPGEINYVGVQMNPMLFQDDIMHLITNVNAAHIGNYKMNKIEKKTSLNYNDTKCYYGIIGNDENKTIKVI